MNIIYDYLIDTLKLNYLKIIPSSNVRHTKTIDLKMPSKNNSKNKRNEQKENIYQTFRLIDAPSRWANSDKHHQIKKLIQPNEQMTAYLHNQRLNNFKIMRKRQYDEDGEEEQVDINEEKQTTTTTRKPIKLKQPKQTKELDDQLNNTTTTIQQQVNKQKGQKTSSKSNRLKSNRIKMSTTPMPGFPDFIPDTVLENEKQYTNDNQLSNRSSAPFLAQSFGILVLICIVAVAFYLCFKDWFRKFFTSDRTRASGLAMPGGNKLDIKNVQLLGQAYKEKVSFIFVFLFFKMFFK